MKRLIFSLPLILGSCMSTLLSRNSDDVPTSTLESLHELKAEVAQLTHLMHGQSVDIQLLEEKLSNLSLKRRELASETLGCLQQKVDELESVLTSMRMNVEHSKKQSQHTFDTQLQRLVCLENRVSQHDSSLHIIHDIKTMMGELKSTPGQTYRVESGDTLEGISRKFGLKVEDLKQYNKLQTHQIQIGQVLKIPL